MNKSWFYLVGSIGSLAILTTSCGDGGKPAATPSPSPAAVVSPASTPIAAVPPTTPSPTFAATPTVPGKPAIVVASAGLIAPTNGDNWAKTVTKGRNDPFATLVLQPVLAAKNPLDATGRPQPTSTIATNNSSVIKSGVNKSLPTIKTASNNANVFGKSKIRTKGTTETGIIREGNSVISVLPQKGLPKITVNNKAIKPSKSSTTKIATNNVLRPVNISPTSKTGVTKIAAIPERVVAKPLQAMALEISGVVEVEGRTQVIVKLPSESFSRYIEVGDRVANGRVLIKRVESQQSLSPTVVLEEVGVEVARKVGDKPPATPEASTPTSAPRPQ